MHEVQLYDQVNDSDAKIDVGFASNTICIVVYSYFTYIPYTAS